MKGASIYLFYRFNGATTFQPWIAGEDIDGHLATGTEVFQWGHDFSAMDR